MRPWCLVRGRLLALHPQSRAWREPYAALVHVGHAIAERSVRSTAVERRRQRAMTCLRVGLPFAK
jgi:hypothetical protein